MRYRAQDENLREDIRLAVASGFETKEGLMEYIDGLTEPEEEGNNVQVAKVQSRFQNRGNSSKLRNSIKAQKARQRASGGKGVRSIGRTGK